MSWRFEIVAHFPHLLEGPTWDGRGVLFTEVAASRIHRYVPATGECSVYRDRTNRANGLIFGADGYLYACEGGARRVVRYEGETTKVIANAFGGRLNSPNDLYVDVLGRVWFSDPRYGEDRSDLELDHESVYRADPVGGGRFTLRRITEDTTRPNGLLVSSDLRALYVAQSEPGEGKLRQLRAYPIGSDGALAPHEVLYDFGPDRGIDGMCFDAEGNVVATAGWGDSGPGPMIYVFSPKGEVLERHPTPVDRPTNCAFGDDDLRTLYVTTAPGILLKARTDRRGSLDDPRPGVQHRAAVAPRA